jgi:hypothetical protein
MTKRGLASSAVAVALLVTRAASAQTNYTAQGDSPQWLKDRRYNEGIGVRTGDLELHPGVAGEAGYDSNWFLRSNQQNVENGPPNAPPIPAMEFRITPSLYLSTLSPQRREGDLVAQAPSVAFRAGVNATYREYIGLSSDASQPNNDISQQRNIGGAADARLDILPQRPFGAAIFGSWGRAILPNAVAANPDLSFTSDAVTAGGEFVVQPGSGTLDWHLGYQYQGVIFEQTAGVPYDNSTQDVYTRGRWKFRPHTALMYDARLDFVSYSNAQRQSAALTDSTPVRTRIGLDGLVTERFALMVLAGWGASFYDSTLPRAPQFDSVIGQAELKWFLSASPGVSGATDLGLALSSISLGFTRDFTNSYLGFYDTVDRGYLKFYYFFAGRALLTLEGGVGAVDYPVLLWADGTQRSAPFTDIRADATLFGEYRLSDTFGINSTLRYTANLSNTVIPGAEGAGQPSFGMAWNRFEAYLGARWFM